MLLPIKAAHMKCAAVFLVALVAFASESFGVLRPLFPVKPMPPFGGDTGVMGDDTLRNSANESSGAARK
jgi:hypothetical protein